MHSRFKHAHFVGIGGIGMCGIAEVLLNLGYRVSGSDIRPGPSTERLERLGAVICFGHDESHVGAADVVVTSSAIAGDNPEVVAAERRAIPVIPRAEMLAELMRLKHGVAIAGAHGKTTTTSLTASLLTSAGLDPTAVIGGRLRTLGSTSRLGRGEVLVAEADESDRSFLMLSPIIAVATNIDREHMESYSGQEDLISAFATFLNKVPFFGAAILCADDPILREMPARLRRRSVMYGIGKDAEVSATSVWTRDHESGYVLVHRGQELGEVRLKLPGLHNIQNSLAAVAVGLELELSFATIAEGLFSFEGVDRRLDVKGEVSDVLVIDDYAHHPTEIRATLAALKASYGRRVVCVFEPHRFSRADQLRDEFATSFGDADVVLVTDLYPAGEKPIAGVDGQAMAAAIEKGGHPDVRFVGAMTDAARAAVATVNPGDLMVTLGAGKVTQAADVALAFLRAR